MRAHALGHCGRSVALCCDTHRTWPRHTAMSTAWNILCPGSGGPGTCLLAPCFPALTYWCTHTPRRSTQDRSLDDSNRLTGAADWAYDKGVSQASLCGVDTDGGRPVQACVCVRVCVCRMLAFVTLHAVLVATKSAQAVDARARGRGAVA